MRISRSRLALFRNQDLGAVTAIKKLLKKPNGPNGPQIRVKAVMAMAKEKTSNRGKL